MFENNKTKWSEIYSTLSEGDKEDYEKFFQSALKKFGVESPAELSKEKKKEFYNYVDKNYIGDHEKDNPNAEGYEMGTDKYKKYMKNLTPGENVKEEDGMPKKKEMKKAAQAETDKAMKSEEAEIEEKMDGRKKFSGKQAKDENEKRRAAQRKKLGILGPNEEVEIDDEQIDEKAVSVQQQKLMGLAYAVKKGDIDAPSEEIQKIADSMSLEELKKMAEGKHKDLPIRASENTYSEESLNTLRTIIKKEQMDKIDARRKAFKEKVKKLAYEKAKKIAAGQDIDEKKTEKEEVKNKVTVNPTVGENRAYRAYETVKKLREKNTVQEDQELENKILNHLKEAVMGTITDTTGGYKQASDYPASAMSIAKAFKVSPMTVQSLLDRMVESGTIVRSGDAYSYQKMETAVG